MTTQLKKLSINKVSFVDEGSCGEAHIKLVKRKENEPMTYEEIMKSLSPDQQAVLKAQDTANAEALKKAMDEKAAAEADKKKAEEDLEKEKGDFAAFKEDAAKKEEDMKKGKNADDEEEILKAASPAVRAILEKARAQAAAAELVAKRALEQETEKEAIAKAKSLKSLNADESEIQALYKSATRAGGDLAKQVFDILEKANAVIEKSAAFESKGTGAEGNTGADPDAVWAEIEKVAEPIAKSRGLSQTNAINAVLAENRELSQKYTDALRNA